VVYLNLSSDPFAFPEAEWDRIVVELQATQPEVIEGEPIYLSLLARAAKKRGVKVPSVRAVILTYGKASTQHSTRIAEVFPAAQVDLYGSTEAGYLFVGEAFKDNSRVIDANAFIELVPWRVGRVIPNAPSSEDPERRVKDNAPYPAYSASTLASFSFARAVSIFSAPPRRMTAHTACARTSADSCVEASRTS